jgi:hypothetical protein
VTGVQTCALPICFLNFGPKGQSDKSPGQRPGGLANTFSMAETVNWVMH